VASPLGSIIALDGVVSDEKLHELLALETEYPELDFKTTIDTSTTEGLVELAADVGAMQVRGGYIVGGVDGRGKPCGRLKGVDLSLFDEATLRSKLLKYLPDRLVLRTAVHVVNGHDVVLIFVGPHPSGCAFFRADGQYMRGTKTIRRFLKGDVFWRNGTSSERIGQSGLEEIIETRIATEKETWLDEQQEIRRREREDAQRASEAQRLARSAVGSVNYDLPASELTAAALELLRDEDSIALIRLLRDGVERAQGAIERDEVETELGDVLDKLICLAAVFLVYEQTEWLDRVIATLAQIYSLAVPDQERARSLGLSTHIDPETPAPRIWLEIIQRVFALGALAVRLEAWPAVRTLTLQLPARIDYGYEVNWLRHAVTMSSRAQHLDHVKEGQQIFVSLLSLAREQVQRLVCLRPDGITADDDAIFTALAQFDVLSNIVAIGDAGTTKTKVFYTNFARFRQDRVDPVVERLLRDESMRRELFARDDEHLAAALMAIAEMAHAEGVRYDGFMGWGAGSSVGDFIADHLASA
jgi:hypothetical protein